MVSTNDVKDVDTGTRFDNTGVAENQPPRTVAEFSTTTQTLVMPFTYSIVKG
jgi:hypothetical protein